jgi:hypothetical protein
VTGSGLLLGDDIRAIDRAEYTRVLEAYLAALRPLPGVTAVYQLGNIKVPGISDIDLIVVVDDRIQAGTNFWELLRSVTGPHGPYVFSHPSYVISRDIFPQLPLLFYADNLRHLWGEKLAFVSVPPEQEAFYAYMIAVESAIVQTFPFLRSLTTGTATNLRSLLCHLNAVRHNFSTIARWVDCRDRRRWTNYLEAIDRLRTGWFALDEQHRFAQTGALTREGYAILLEIVDELAEIGIAQGFVCSGTQMNWLSLLDINVLLRFSPTGKAEVGRLTNPLSSIRQALLLRSLQANSRRLRELLSDVPLLTLPGAIYPLIGSWSESHGRVGEVLEARQLGAGRNAWNELPSRVQPWLQRREQELNRYFAFIERSRVAGMLPLTTTSWLSPSRSWPNRLKTGWSSFWVKRSLAKD